MHKFKSYFHFQYHGLTPLWRWGLGSMVVGLGLLFSRKPFVRGFALQTAGWGLIDALLAWSGRRGALRQIRAGARDDGTQARRWQIILLVNAGLDLSYILGGWWFWKRSSQQPDRAGAGAAVVIQGLFLLIYDLWFGLRHGPWRKP